MVPVMLLSMPLACSLVGLAPPPVPPSATIGNHHHSLGSLTVLPSLSGLQADYQRIRPITIHYGTQESAASERGVLWLQIISGISSIPDCAALRNILLTPGTDQNIDYPQQLLFHFLTHTHAAPEFRDIFQNSLGGFPTLKARDTWESASRWRGLLSGLTSIEVILLGDNLPPVLGALSGQLLGLVQAADGQRLNVFLERFLAHLLQGLLHGAEESLHTALQVVGRFLWLDNEAQPLHSVGLPGPAEHDVAWGGCRREKDMPELSTKDRRGQSACAKCTEDILPQTNDSTILQFSTLDFLKWV